MTTRREMFQTLLAGGVAKFFPKARPENISWSHPIKFVYKDGRYDMVFLTAVYLPAETNGDNSMEGARR